MSKISAKYGPEVQKVSTDTPIDEILYLLKRDGGVFVKGLVPIADVDKTYERCRERLESDAEWNGSFFPKETQRAPALLALSPTYAITMMMNPTFQKVREPFRTTRSWFWWGNEKKVSVSKPYVRIGPGGKAQTLHRDDYISNNIRQEISEWNNKRDRNRETAVGLFVAGSKVIKENGGTQFIPRSHLWGTDRCVPPRVDQCVYAEMEKGGAFIMLASAYLAGEHNTTENEKRLVFSTFSIRGYLRQEENQFLCVPQDIAKKYERPVQEYTGYAMIDPACGYVDQMDPIFVLRPELKGVGRSSEF